MKVIQTHEFKDGKFIFTRTASEFTDYELGVLRKLYKNQGLSAYADEFVAKYNAVIYNLIEVGLIYKDYELSPNNIIEFCKESKNILQEKCQIFERILSENGLQLT